MRIIKFLLAGVVATIFMTGACFFYYKIPLSYTDPEDVTDYKYEGNTAYFSAKEGYGFGKTNNDGYLNTFDWDENTPIEVLLLGGSHLEFMEGNIEDSAASKLNEMFGRNAAYNLGMSGHQFLTCVENLEHAIEKYHPKYVVLDPSDLSFSNEELKQAVAGTYANLPSRSGGLYDVMREDPFFRMSAYQLRTLVTNLTKKTNADDADANAASDAETDFELVNELLQNMREIADAHNVTLIIVYHPTTQLDEDGALSINRGGV